LLNNLLHNTSTKENEEAIANIKKSEIYQFTNCISSITLFEGGQAKTRYSTSFQQLRFLGYTCRTKGKKGTLKYPLN
jgi:hypothetical protein